MGRSAWNGFCKGIHIFMFCSAFIFVFEPKTAHSCTIVANSTPPLSIHSGSGIRGFSMDLLVEVFDRIDKDTATCEVMPVPFARAYDMTRNIPDTYFFSVARAPEREHHFRWVGPIFAVKMDVIGLEENRSKVTSYSDLQRYSIGTLINSQPENLLRQNGIPSEVLSRVGTPNALVRMLINKRVDFIAHVKFVFEMQAAEQEHSLKRFRSVFNLGSTDLYFALHPSTPESHVLELQNALDDIKKVDLETGFSDYQRILNFYHLTMS